MTAIEFDTVTKQYGETVALDEFSLTVQEGEVYGLIGPNGAGKSTTVGLISDTIRPTTGRVSVLGQHPTRDIVSLHHRVGILPDEYSLYERQSGRSHLRYAIDAKGADDDSEELLERVGLAGEGDRPAGEYSTGMKQRLLLAVALVGQPELLVLDEPFNGLDPHGVELVQDLITREQRRGTTVLVSSHVLDSVERICDRIGILNHGHLVTVGTSAELRNNSSVSTTVTVETVDPPESVCGVLETVDGVEEVTVTDDNIELVLRNQAIRHDVQAALLEADVSAGTVTLREPSLHDVFIDYTT